MKRFTHPVTAMVVLGLAAGTAGCTTAGPLEMFDASTPAAVPGMPTGRTVTAALGALGAPASAARPARATTGPPVHQYRVVDLGTLGGDVSAAFGMNDRGDVVGSSDTATDGTHAFLWRHGKMTDLGVLDSSHPYSDAYDVNNRGEVVGGSDVHGGTAFHGFVWRDGRLTDVGTLGGSFSVAVAINDRGDVTGVSETPDGRWHGFLWRDARMIDLGTDTARDINNRTQVVGQSLLPSGHVLAYRWDRGRITPIDAGPAGEGVSINNRGWVAGEANRSGWRTGFLWRYGAVTWLTEPGTSSSVTAINDRGQVLGVSGPIPDGEPHPFLWQEGRVVDLTTRGIPASSGVRAINNHGMIAGSYYFTDGIPHAALFS